MTRPALAASAESELAAAVRRLRPYLRRGAGFSLMASLLLLMPSWYMLEVYDRVVNSRSHLTLAMLTLMVVGAYVLMEILEWAHTHTMHEAGVAWDTELASRVVTASFDAKLRHLPGGSIQALADLRTLRDFLDCAALKAVMEAPVALVFLALIFAISPVLGWAALVGALAQTLIGWLNEKSTQPPLVAGNRMAIAAQQYADGSLRNAEVIEAMGMLKNIHRLWMDKQREFLKLQATASDRAGFYQAWSRFVQTVMGSALLGLGAWLLLHQQLNGGAGMMIVGSILGGRVLAPLVAVVTQWRLVVNARDAWNRLSSLLSALPPRPASMPLPPPRGLLLAENLITAAPGSQVPILRGVSFNLNPGEVLAVVGPSAAGKTTLARVLVGLWPSAGGKARLDGVDVFSWNKAELGPTIGYLPQGIELFDGTLAENIARFGTVEQHKVEAAAQAVGLHAFIQSLPQGYDTEVGQDGARLSGGQRQRVGLARALYGDPVFVVLDEPNASLDDAGDAALAQAIAQAKARGTTFVVMTHRSSILSVSDKMLVLRDGVVQAFGPRDDVLQAMQQSRQQTQPPAAQPGRATTALPSTSPQVQP